MALALWTGCGDDDSTGGGETPDPVDINGALVVPAEWAGTWEIALTFRDCTSNEILSQEVITSQVCPGDTLVNPFIPIFENCDGTRTGNHLEASCEYAASFDACQITVATDFTMDVEGNQLSGSGTITTTATPGCGSLFTTGCQRVGISGTRISTSTSGCDDPTVTTARRLFLR
jgi:hypothetical protein